MSGTFEGKVVVITGGGGGIGRAAAARFLQDGASVVLSGTREAKLRAAQEALDPSGERSVVIPHRPGERLLGVSTFRDWGVVGYRRGGLARLGTPASRWR